MARITHWTLRRGLAMGIVAAAVLAVALATIWAGTTPAGAQDAAEVPAKPTGLQVTTEPGSLSVSVDWGDVDGADSYLVRWREYVAGQKLNEGVETQSSAAVITVADYGEWVVQVSANAVTVREGGSASYRVSLNTAPPLPVRLEPPWFFYGSSPFLDDQMGDNAGYLVPNGWTGELDGPAHNWRSGISVTLTGSEDDNDVDDVTVWGNVVSLVSAADLNMSMEDWNAAWGINPDGNSAWDTTRPYFREFFGPEVKITVRDND